MDNLGICLEEKDYSPVLTQFEEGLKFIPEENRYQSKLLFKSETRPIFNNKPLAVQRLKGLLEKLNKSKERLELYQATLNDQEKLGIISKVPKSEYDEVHSFFLPYKGVYKESSESTKLRLVYDGSARMKNCPSLNQLLNTGPCLLTNLCGMLLKFRIYPIILTADIIKAYHNILIDPSERDYTRFLWKENGDPKNDLIIYRFNRIPFGLASSQFILNGTLQYHILKKANLIPPIAEKLADSYYSDNLIFGCFNENEAKTALFPINEMHASINFPLSKWNSNAESLRQCFSELDASYTHKETETMLGLIWDTNNDTIGFNISKLLNSLEPYLTENPILPTKRLILSHISSVFDPMGYLVPILLYSKNLFQTLCINQVAWDDQISAAQFVDFLSWINLIKSIANLRIHRCLPVPVDVKFSLRGYCDASTKCYAACVYLIAHENGKPVSGNLLICKGRITPIKPVSIPKLELLSAVLLVRLMNTVVSLLPDFSFQKMEFFTDSSTVLYWLNGNLKDWNQFVLKRINEITTKSAVSDWGHIPSHLNRSDLPTRGVDGSNVNSLEKWYVITEPNELNINVSSFPWNEAKPIDNCILLSDCKIESVFAVNESAVPCIETIIDIDRYSSYNKLINVTCGVLKFVNLLKKQNVSHNDLKQKAQNLWIMAVQQKMLQPKIVNKKQKTSQYFKQFQLFKDGNVYRCKSRLNNAAVSYNFKFPVLLDKSHAFTKLLILNLHNRLLHAGTQQTLLSLREQFWVPQARKLINFIINRCIRCQKLFKQPYSPVVMPDLPEFRLEECPPFSHVGIDFCGPFLVKFPKLNKKDQSEPALKKIYVCVFSCAVSRAIHFEYTYGMTMDEFIKCFRRFTSIRNIPCFIYSDNFSTFKKSDKDLHAVISEPRFREYFETLNIQWKYSTPRAPWTHGFTERLISLLKNCLKKVLFKALTEISEFHTVLKESEAIINNRPLSYQSFDLISEPPITPNVLINGRNLCQLPPLDAKFAKQNIDNGFVSKRMRYLERLRINFWNNFYKEYLSTLNEVHFRRKQSDSTLDVKEGTICILRDSNVPRLKWNLAKILKILPCRDSRVRSVEILYINKSNERIITKRAITSLIPLELGLDDKDS